MALVRSKYSVLGLLWVSGQLQAQGQSKPSGSRFPLLSTSAKDTHHFGDILSLVRPANVSLEAHRRGFRGKVRKVVEMTSFASRNGREMGVTMSISWPLAKQTRGKSLFPQISGMINPIANVN